MGVLEVFEKKACGKKPRIAIGAGWERQGYVEKVFRAADAVGFADIIVVGSTTFSDTNVNFLYSKDVERDLIRLLKSGEVDGAVRGSCSASKVLHEINGQFNPAQIGRIALLETSEGQDFFFAPVGIDEGNAVNDRLFLIREGIKLGNRLGIELKIGILSCGRESDVERHKNVGNSINEAEKIVETIKKEGFSNIKNYNILIEDAVEDGSNFIVAPDGISGNLIFRTLAYLGGGRGYGAVLTGIDEVYIDTSRAGKPEDYVAAIMMACALKR